jgi:hypothetical protein
MTEIPAPHPRTRGHCRWSHEEERITEALVQIARAINTDPCNASRLEQLRQRRRVLTTRLEALRQAEMAELAPAEPSGGGRRG